MSPQEKEDFRREVTETHRRLMVLPSMSKESPDAIADAAYLHTAAAWRRVAAGLGIPVKSAKS